MATRNSRRTFETVIKRVAERSPVRNVILENARDIVASDRPREHRTMIQQLPQSAGNILAFEMSGKLHDEDYKKFVPMVDDAIANHGTVRLLAHFRDFHGWDLHAVWDDIKFATTHCAKIERIALVGDKAWEKWMAAICVPFTMAHVRYFDVADLAAAHAWLAGS